MVHEISYSQFVVLNKYVKMKNERMLKAVVKRIAIVNNTTTEQVMQQYNQFEQN